MVKKEPMVLELHGTPAYLKKMKKHLNAEHPSTKHRLRWDK